MNELQVAAITRPVARARQVFGMGQGEHFRVIKDARYNCSVGLTVNR